MVSYLEKSNFWGITSSHCNDDDDDDDEDDKLWKLQQSSLTSINLRDNERGSKGFKEGVWGGDGALVAWKRGGGASVIDRLK